MVKMFNMNSLGGGGGFEEKAYGHLGLSDM